MQKPAKQFIFFALAASGEGISGGDRIFIELAKRWSKQYKIMLYVWEEGLQMCKRQSLGGDNISYQTIQLKPWDKLGFVITYLARIIAGIKIGFSAKLTNDSSTVVYSASEFWMDSLPAYILKKRFKHITWVAAWFQTAPNPLRGFTYGKRENTYKLSAFLYWFVQLPIKPLIANAADFVLVNNEEEKNQYPKLNKKGRAIVLIGAVDLKKIDEYKVTNKSTRKTYDAVFQGRFHPQKGVSELIEIWHQVVSKKKDARLVMIGDGPLMKEVRLKIKELGLEKNIELLGYVFDGNKKYESFAKSRVVVHPAFYDSGGMATAEAMAFGLPAVGFNLPSYESYYPKGMLKAKMDNIQDFADLTLKLLTDEKQRVKIGKEAQEQIYKKYSWDSRAEEILHAL